MVVLSYLNCFFFALLVLFLLIFVFCLICTLVHQHLPQEDPAVVAQRTEKQRMASMLFGGTGPAMSAAAATPASRSSRSLSSSGAKATATAAATAAAPRSSGPTTASSLPQKAPTSSAVTAAVPDPVDLLDFTSVDGSSPDAVAGPSTGAAANGAAHGRSSSSPDQIGMDLLGVGGDATGSASSSRPNPAAQTLDDFLGGGGGGSNGGASGVPEGMPNGRRSSSSSASGGQAWPPPAAVNTTATTRQRAGTVGSASSASGSVGAPSWIGGGGATSTTGDLDLSALMLGGGGGSGGGFSLGGRAVRPLTIVTGDFGQKWMACSEERRAVGAGLSPGLGSPKAVAERLGARLGVHTVEIIPHTAEGICAGQLDGGGVCLVHCKVRCLVRFSVRVICCLSLLLAMVKIELPACIGRGVSAAGKLFCFVSLSVVCRV